jgi:hypothetical protein
VPVDPSEHGYVNYGVVRLGQRISAGGPEPIGTIRRRLVLRPPDRHTFTIYGLASRDPPKEEFATSLSLVVIEVLIKVLRFEREPPVAETMNRAYEEEQEQDKVRAVQTESRHDYD